LADAKGRREVFLRPLRRAAQLLQRGELTGAPFDLRTTLRRQARENLIKASCHVGSVFPFSTSAAVRAARY